MSSSLNPKTVLLKGQPIGYEAPASAPIVPGMFLQVGAGGKVAPHGTTGAAAHAALVARENEVVGGGIQTSYDTDDNVLYWACKPGDMVYALLETGASVVEGAKLASNAAGALEAAGVNFPIAEAMEAVANATGVNVRIRVRIL